MCGVIEKRLLLKNICCYFFFFFFFFFYTQVLLLSSNNWELLMKLGLMSLFTNSLEDWVRFQVRSYQSEAIQEME